MKRTNTLATEAIVVFMGTTGTGKSTFIHLVTNSDNIHVGHDLESQTTDVCIASYNTGDGQHVVLVDTPGFDDSHKGVSDTDILERIAKFLQANGGQKFNGLIYLHRISDPRMDYTAKKTLEIFSQLCGDANFANVGIVTTHWSIVGRVDGENRENALRKTYFKHLIDGGAKMFRHNGGAESAKSIVSEFVQKPAVTLKIQKELNAHRALADTSAGAVIMKEMKEMDKEHRKRMQDLKEEVERESEDMRAEFEAERRQLAEQIAQIQEDQNRLQIMYPNTAARPTRHRSRGTTRRRSSFELGLIDWIFNCKGMTILGILSIVGLYFVVNNRTSGYDIVSLLYSAGLPFVVPTANRRNI